MKLIGCGTLWPQWLAVTELFLMTTITGLIAGWTSPYLAKLDAIANPDSELPINKDEASWIASLINISRTIGSILGAISTYYIGTKSTSLVSGVPVAFGWICFLIMNSVTIVYMSRILSGIGIGMYYSSYSLYIGEISDPKIRGALVSLNVQGFLIGNLCGNIMGKYFDMWLFATVSLVLNVIFMVLFSKIPHSPHYLIRCNKMNEAAESIRWYDRNADVKNELKALEEFLTANQSHTFWDGLCALRAPVNRKTLLMLCIITVCTQLSGPYAFSSYMEIIVTNAKLDIMTPSDLIIGVSVIGIFSSWLTIYTIDRCGRTIMLLGSSIGAALAMFLIGLNYQLLDLGYNDSRLQWLSIIGTIIYRIMSALGLLTVPSALTSEMFAPNVKGIGSCIISMNVGIFAFAASRSYQPLVTILTEKYVFWIYALLMITTGLYTIVFVPETKGKSLAEIQKMLSTGKKQTLNSKTKISENITLKSNNEFR